MTMEKKIKIGLIILLVILTVSTGVYVLLSRQQTPTEPQPADSVPERPDITVVPKNFTCQDREKKQAKALGLSCRQFRILSESVTQFAIKSYYPGYEDEFLIVWDKPYQEMTPIPEGCFLVTASFRVKLPSDTMDVFFCGDKVYFHSFEPGSSVDD